MKTISMTLPKFKFFNPTVTLTMRIIVPIIFFIGTLVSLSSCDKKSPEPLNAKKYGGTVSFNLNGGVESFSQNNISVINDELDLSSLLQKNEVFGFRLVNGIAIKDYEIDSRDSINSNTKIETGVLWYESTDGHYTTWDGLATWAKKVGGVTITSINEQAKTMSGTFTASIKNGANKLMVTNGVFTDVPYQSDDRGTGDLHIAKIDGTEFKGRIFSSSGYDVSYAGEHFKLISFNQIPSAVTAKTYDVSELVLLSDNKYEPFSITYFNGIYSYRVVSGTVTFSTVDQAQYLVEGTYNIVVESYPVPGKFISITEGHFKSK